MAAWSTLTHRVLTDVPRCSQPAAEQALLDAAIELCNESHVYIHTLPAIDVVADTASYSLTSDVSGTEIVAVKKAWHSGVRLDYAPIDALNEGRDEWWLDESTQAQAFTHRGDPSTLILYPIPTESEDDALRVEVALRPTLAATSLVDWVVNRYAQQLSCGAKAKLLAQPEKPWTNIERSVYYGRMFHAAKVQARADATRGLMPSALSARMKPAA